VPTFVGVGPESDKFWFALAAARSLLVMGVCALPLVASWRCRLSSLISLRPHLGRAG
jgi:hypothetical protein